ncbi:Uma2 family endonuclease [Nocardioides humi]|uniref:Uma2 family endonuclease n=2 Tax=Nocardioides humi TaxID=449461 RepID=A0ABN2AR52_9ACTN
MSLEEYLALPEGMHAEYVDGEVIVSPPAASGHNKAQRRIANVIEESLADELDVRTEAGWQRQQRYRIPDVAVFPEKDPAVVYDDSTPILVVEVLSPSTASEDTVRKSGEYQQGEVTQYWIVDRDRRTLSVFVNNGEGWDRLLDLDEKSPTGTVTVGEWGEVALDLDALLRP